MNLSKLSHLIQEAYQEAYNDQLKTAAKYGAIGVGAYEYAQNQDDINNYIQTQYNDADNYLHSEDFQNTTQGAINTMKTGTDGAFDYLSGAIQSLVQQDPAAADQLQNLAQQNPDQAIQVAQNLMQ